MFVKFLIIATGIIIGGPIYNEDGGEALKNKGFEKSIKAAWAEREPLDYSKLND